MNKLISQLKAARECSTPILMVTTPDQPAVAQEIMRAINGKKKPDPVILWDRVNGFLAGNETGKQALIELCKSQKIEQPDLPFATSEAHSAMRLAAHLPGHTVLIAFTLNRFMHEEQYPQTIQAILNLRDLFKGDQRMLVGLSPDFRLPPEIQHDVIILDDPLPTDDGYAKLITDLHAAPETPIKVDPKVVEQATRAVRGLSSFEAEQVISMSLASTGFTRLDLESAWALKISAVSKVKGLTMTLDGPDLSDLRGLDSIVGLLSDLWNGPEPPEVVVRVDEIDKTMAGLGTHGGPGDNTGVSQDLHQQFLVNMEQYKMVGAVLVGVRGSGKTVLTESIGKAHGVPTIAMDAGKMKGSHVGESEAAFRDAFRTIHSIGGERVLVLATCNKLDVLPPELLRRFKLGIYYFDILSAEERDALWPIYLKKYGHKVDSKRPPDDGWTGAEIRNCCELAFKLRRSVFEIGTTRIIPVTQSDPASVEAGRTSAEGRFFSASYPGPYHRPVQQSSVSEPTFARKFQNKGVN